MKILVGQDDDDEYRSEVLGILVRDDKSSGGAGGEVPSSTVVSTVTEGTLVEVLQESRD